MLKIFRNTKQAQIFTALILTSILSVGSGFVLIKNATALPGDFLAATSKEFTKQNSPSNRLPRSVANAVLQDLSRREGISIRELRIANSRQQTWRNGCLELQQPDELCTQALVPGWRVVVSRGRQNWIYHTNKTGSVVKLNQANTGTIKPIPIPVGELPPPLDRNVVFREISSGGITGRTYQTVLLNDGQLIRVRIGDANDSERSVRRLTPQQVRQFEQLLRRYRSDFNNLRYPAPKGAADFITYTLTSRLGNVQYNDISQENLPQNLKAVIEAWKNLISSAQ